jgi:sirohydrochlorin cobaltochelatase
MKAILLVSHGSRSPKTKEEISGLVNLLRQRLPETIVEYAFLEIESPSIPEGIDTCIAQGALELLVALNFLNSGRHVDDDIPQIVKAAKGKYPQISFAITKPVGQHPQIPNLFIDLINNA